MTIYLQIALQQIYAMKQLPVRYLLPALFLTLHCSKKADIIITDDILMLTTPAIGLETEACTDFSASRSLSVTPQNTQRVAWSEGKALSGDTLKIIRLEVLRDTGSVAKFTMTLRPIAGAPSEIQCMKGFGCDGKWVNFPWKSPEGNFLNHTVHKFKVVPQGVSDFTIENYNTGETLVVKVNPPL